MTLTQIKTWVHERKIFINWVSLKLNSSGLQKGKVPTRSKYLQSTDLTKDSYPKYVYKKLLNLSNERKTTNNSIIKCAKSSNRHLTKQHIQWRNKHMKSYSTSHVRELQMKASAIWHYYTLNRMAKSKTLITPNADEDLTQKGTLHSLVVEMPNGTATLEDRWQFLAKINIFLPNDLTIHHAFVYLSKWVGNISTQKLHSYIYDSFIYS